MKRTIAILLSVILVIGLVSVAAVNAADNVSRFTVDGKEYTANAGTTVTYKIDMTTPVIIENGQFVIYYPGEALEVQSVTFDSDVLGAPTCNYKSPAVLGKEIDFNFSDVTNGYDFTTKKTLVTVEFKATGAGSGDVYLGKGTDTDGNDLMVICDMNDKDVIDQTVFEETVTGASIEGDDKQPADDSVKPVVKKKANPVKVTVAKKTVKASKLKKKAQTVKKAFKVTKAQGTVTVAKVKKGTTAKIYKKITVKKNGTIKFKKGKYAKKTYSVKIKVTAKGNTNYNAKSVTKTVKIKVK